MASSRLVHGYWQETLTPGVKWREDLELVSLKLPKDSLVYNMP